MSELLHEMKTSLEPGYSETPLVTHCCGQRANHSTVTYSSKNIVISWAASHTSHNSESIPSRDDFPLDYLHPVLTYRYCFVRRRHESMSTRRTGSRVNATFERFVTWDGYQFRIGGPSISETSLTTHCCGQCANHSAIYINTYIRIHIYLYYIERIPYLDDDLKIWQRRTNGNSHVEPSSDTVECFRSRAFISLISVHLHAKVEK